MLTDINGLPIAISVTSAQPHDSRGGWRLLETATPELTRLTKVFADAAYAGLAAPAGEQLGVTVDIRRRPEGTHWFVPLQPLWRVERDLRLALPQPPAPPRLRGDRDLVPDVRPHLAAVAFMLNRLHSNR